VTEPREPDEINSRRFGNWCARVVGRWIEGFKLVRGGKVHQAQQWGVEKEIGIELLHSPGISGLNGTNGNGNGISPKPEVPQETCNYFTGAVRSAPCKHCGQSYAAHK